MIPGTATRDQVDEVQACIRACADCKVLTEVQARVAIDYIGGAPSQRFLRNICSTLLLELAGRGHDALYQRVRELEDALAGAARQELPPSLVGDA